MGATACLLQSLWQSCRGGCARVSGIFTADWKKKKIQKLNFGKMQKSQHFDLYLMFGKIE